METIPNKPGVKSGKRTYDIAIPEYVEHPKFEGVSIRARRAKKSMVLSNHYTLSFQKSKIY